MSGGACAATLLVALAFAATGCGTEEPTARVDPTEERAGDSAEPAAGVGDATAAASAEHDRAAIREFDFTTVEWREQVSEQYLTPLADTGDADPMAGPIVTLGEAAYVDADGDGAEDALLPLVIQDGNSLSEIYYIWTWDADEQRPRQVENPIARAHDCGAVVDKVSPDAAQHAFVITERLRQPGTEGACADAPTLRATRSVTLADRWPVLTTGIGGHGGICPQPTGHDGTWPVEETVLLAGPRPAAGRIQDPQLNWFAEADISGHPWLYREGWLLVNFGPLVGTADDHFAGYGDYTPCAWVRVDPARQSEYGMLPPGQG